MLTKKQLQILKTFTKNIFLELTFKEIKIGSKEKSNNLLQTALKEFLKQNIIITKKTGNVHTYKLNLKNNLTLAYLELLNHINKNLPVQIKNLLKEIQQTILQETTFFILLVFGSYAKGKQTIKSDLDIAIFIESENQRKKLTPLIETIKRREIIKIDYHLILISEYIEMLSEKYENLAKQIQKNNLIIYGYTNYINLYESKNE
jgi:predicted nucleotidyltransferase